MALIEHLEKLRHFHKISQYNSPLRKQVALEYFSPCPPCGVNLFGHFASRTMHKQPTH